MSSEKPSSRAREYQREQLTLELFEEIATLLFLTIWVWIAPYLAEALFRFGSYSSLILFATIMYLSYQIGLFAFDYMGGYRLEHKYDLSTETFGGWLWRHTKSITLSGLLLGVMIVILYSAMWHLSYWYVWCWAGWVLFSIVLAQVFPVLILPIFYQTKKLENEALLQRFQILSEGTGIDVEGVYNLELSKTTRKGNAMLAGLGRTRRVLLGDTLLDRLDEQQLEVIYAHELGHHIHRHFRKSLILYAISSIALFGLIYLVFTKNISGAKPEMHLQTITRLPLMCLTLSLFTFLWRPVSNAVSRYFERQSDRYALERTQQPEKFASAFEVLAEQNLADPNPARWVVWLYHDHPPIHERIALAKSFKKVS
ncbi:MAG: M48 family metallopeptidase [Phycisphaerae bacterium]|jgi:STE24 endopeptidase|nr:M48 family metallopeptidase [Phycisphaerae bacterium]